MSDSASKGSVLEKKQQVIVSANDIDVAAGVIADDDDEPIDPEVARRLRRKIDLHILPLMMGESLSVPAVDYGGVLIVIHSALLVKFDESFGDVFGSRLIVK